MAAVIGKTNVMQVLVQYLNGVSVVIFQSPRIFETFSERVESWDFAAISDLEPIRRRYAGASLRIPKVIPLH